MEKKLHIAVSAVIFVFVLEQLSFAGSCGCGGGGQSSCHGAAQGNGCGGGLVQDSCHQVPAPQQLLSSGDAAQGVANESVPVGNKICPVMGGKVDEKIMYSHDGKIYNFCCLGCIAEFKKDPQKYVQKVAAELKAGGK